MSGGYTIGPSIPPSAPTDTDTWSVTDPGFPRGGGASPPGGRQHTILPNFPKNCTESKEFGPGERRASLTPPLDPPLLVVVTKTCTVGKRVVCTLLECLLVLVLFTEKRYSSVVAVVGINTMDCLTVYVLSFLNREIQFCAVADPGITVPGGTV